MYPLAPLTNRHGARDEMLCMLPSQKAVVFPLFITLAKYKIRCSYTYIYDSSYQVNAVILWHSHTDDNNNNNNNNNNI